MRKKYGMWTLVIVAVVAMIVAIKSGKVQEWFSKIGVKGN